MSQYLRMDWCGTWLERISWDMITGMFGLCMVESLPRGDLEYLSIYPCPLDLERHVKRIQGLGQAMLAGSLLTCLWHI